MVYNDWTDLVQDAMLYAYSTIAIPQRCSVLDAAHVQGPCGTRSDEGVHLIHSGLEALDAKRAHELRPDGVREQRLALRRIQPVLEKVEVHHRRARGAQRAPWRRAWNKTQYKFELRKA